MSNEECILSDGRKTSDLKVNDLKKELEKLGKRKTGTKLELFTRLNEALSASSKSAEERQVDSNNLNTKDDEVCDSNEVNQSADTLELGVPIDDSLNSVDDMTQEDQIQINLSKDEEADMTLDEKDCNTMVPEEERVVCEKTVEILSDSKQCVNENETDIMLNMEMDSTLEMYEGDNIDLEMEDRDSKRDIINESEAVTDPKISETHNADIVDNVEETEEGEVVPITARLGKRKVADENESDHSPKKAKKKGLKETKGAGHIVEEPLRMKSPKKSKNFISDILRVDHLVRPFTMTQLQDVLSLKGRVTDLWLNKIKSVAYVKYESESAAINARESLDGCKWPSINPKLLVADFATYKEMEWMKENGDSGAHPPSYLKQQQDSNKDVGLPAWKDNDGGARLARENRERPVIDDAKRRHSRERVHRNEPVKEEQKVTRREKGHEKSREKRKGGPAAKLLEDLFRKTVTQPAIYWLPVSRDEAKKPVSTDMIVLGYNNHS